MPAVYIHIPFCKQKCAYCDFTSYAGLGERFGGYVDALTREIASQAPKLPERHAGSIYIGGGTPTLLEPGLIERVLRAVSEQFDVAADAEISIEANPETVTEEKLSALRSAGVNRLSMGVQSLDDGLLALLGRRHSADRAVEAYCAARAAGFDNVSLDFIFGIPGQSLANWALTLAQAEALGPEHLSCYGLTVEHGTALERMIEAGTVEEPDDDVQADMLAYTIEALTEAGYEHYEISNYARPGKRCKHNLTYWDNADYIGFGAGAHSKIAGTRFCNIARVDGYIEAANAGSPVCESTQLTREDEMGETVFLGLRVTDGIDLAQFRARFGVGIEDAYGERIDGLLKDGLVTYADGSLRLTSKGVMLGNEVFSRFV